MNIEYPFLKKYAGFILENHLDELVLNSIDKARKDNLPILKQLAHFTSEELFEMSKKGYEEDVLLPLCQNTPFKKVEESIEKWKANSLILPKDQITALDLTGIYNVRKHSMIQMIPEFKVSLEESIALILEIENYFGRCLDMAYLAYEEIQRGALRESQIILDGILKSMPVIVSRFDKEGNQILSLGKGLEAMGLKEGELVGTNLFKTFPSTNTRRAFEGEKIVFEGNAQSRTGESRYFQSWFFPEENGVIGFSIDVTHQKNAEEKLRERDYFINQIADSTPIIIQVYDRINNVDLYSNRELVDILGYTSEEVTSMGKAIAQQIVHPDDFSKIIERNKKLEDAKDHEVIESEMRARHKNGTYKWIYTRSTVFKRTPEGKVWQSLSTSFDITDKKETEGKLEKQLRIFDTALSNTVDFNFVFDLNKRFIYINKPLLELFGKTPEEAFGKGFGELGFPDHLVELQNAQLQQVIDTRKPVQGENEFTNDKGEIGYFQYTFVPVLSKDGEVEAIVGSGHDISTIKSNAEQQYRKIFEASNDAILIYNQKGHLIEVNPAGCKMHGYTYQEMVGMQGENFIAKEDVLNFYNFISEVKEGKQFSASLKHVRKDGSQLFVEKTGSVFMFKGEAHFLAVVHDVTERKKAEEALKESEDRFRTLADNIPNLVWIADAEGWISWYNKRWYEYTGTTEESMKGWGWQKVHHPKELPWVLEMWTTSIKAGEPFEMIFPIKGADNLFRPFLTRVSPIRNEAGNIVRWFGTNTDITNQIKIEEALEQKNGELLKINNDLDNFIYTASHDLKSPISNLEGLLNLVSDENEELITEKGKEVLPLVNQSLLRLKTVISELTEIARIQKETDVQYEEISLREMCNEIFELCGNEFKNFKGKISCDFTSIEKVKFSKKNLRSILYNLINNAIKYSAEDREGLVELKSDVLEDYIVITVRDNGLGIPSHQLERIFTMFKRFHTHVDGSGVGLYIVKRIIENAGGKIEVESEEGKGSTFKIFLKADVTIDQHA